MYCDKVSKKSAGKLKTYFCRYGLELISEKENLIQRPFAAMENGFQLGSKTGSNWVVKISVSFYWWSESINYSHYYQTSFFHRLLLLLAQNLWKKH